MEKSKTAPPKIVEFTLKLLLTDDEKEEKLGDYSENYRFFAASRSKFFALIWYCFQLFLAIPAFLENLIYWRYTMLKNYFKTTIRNLKKQKIFSFLNILGLATGIASCLIILQYIVFEVSYDRFNENYPDIYRLRETININEKIEEGADCCDAAGKTISKAFPEILDYVNITQRSAAGIFTHKDIKFREENVFWTTQSFFKIFSFKLLEGNVKTVLSQPRTAAISESTAKRYFGEKNPIGKFLTYKGRMDFKITGIFQDSPKNSHFKSDILLSMINTREGEQNSWSRFWHYTYFLLKPGTDPVLLEQKINNFVEPFSNNVFKEFGFTFKLYIQPLKHIHLKSNFLREIDQNGSEDFVYFLIIISLFILVIAWINYINLSTARSINRGNEIGIRKVLGAKKVQLIKQFLFEFIFYNLIAAFAAVISVKILFPYFNKFTGLFLEFTLWSSPVFWLAFTLLFFAGAILAGIYPALFLSSFKPVTVFKSRTIGAFKGSSLRKGLVIFQFAVSFILIVSTLIVYKQLKFMQDRELGVNIDRTIVIRGASVFEDRNSQALEYKVKTFKKDLLRYPSIENITVSRFVPGENVWILWIVKKEGETAEESENYHILSTDYNFLDIFQLKLLAGRNFSEEHVTDREAVIINEAAMNLLDFDNPESALNKKLIISDDEDTIELTIIGVIKNYNQESLKEAYEPLLLTLELDNAIYSRCAIRINTKDLNKTITLIKDKWEHFFPGNPFDYYFLDESFDNLYKSENQLGKIVGLFAGLAVFIACLGLFGLSYFSILQRIKEISIRKTLGASEQNILRLITKEYILIVVISSIIAGPLSFYYMNKWIQSFAFRINIGFTVYLYTGLMVLSIAFLTVFFQSLKAATANPVKGLRDN